MDITRLAADMRGLIEKAPELAAVRPLLRPAVHMLATGEPVDVAWLAATAGQPPGRTRAALRRMPLTEWSQDGHLIGLCITLHSTPHRIVVRNRILYFWSAMDALVATALLDDDVTLESSCALTGTPLHIEAGHDRLHQVEPSTVAVSVAKAATLRPRFTAALCAEQRFFRSTAAAEIWADSHPEQTYLYAKDAYRYAQLIAELF